MDSATHIVVGACLGEAFLGKKLGKKGMLLGALAHSFPDIDFIAGLFLSTPENLMAHRGFTHSIMCCIIVAPLFAFLSRRKYLSVDISLRRWIIFYLSAIALHLFVDGFNSYGIGWLEPFSRQRFSFNTIFVIDIFFSIWPGIAFLFLLFLNRYNKARKFWWRFGLILPSIYLIWCSYNKIQINNDVQNILISENIPHDRYITVPTVSNSLLWYVVSGNDSGYYVGYRSLLDNEKKISFTYFPRNDSLLKPLKEQIEIERLIQFSQQYYAVIKKNSGIEFNDLRFGQINGWFDPEGEFAFHYYLQKETENRFVVQRGRFKGWSWYSLKKLVKRIGGN